MNAVIVIVIVIVVIALSNNIIIIIGIIITITCFCFLVIILLLFVIVSIITVVFVIINVTILLAATILRVHNAILIIIFSSSSCSENIIKDGIDLPFYNYYSLFWITFTIARKCPSVSLLTTHLPACLWCGDEHLHMHSATRRGSLFRSALCVYRQKTSGCRRQRLNDIRQ